jgi:pimeloyl-ACP methyl ester carboxylesterase
MKKAGLLLVTITAVWGWSGCSKADAPVDPHQYFIEVIHTATARFDDFFASFGEGVTNSEKLSFVEPLASLLLKDITVSAYVITYRTVDYYGNPIVASGTVYFPNDTHIRGVVEVAPIAFIQKTSGASGRIPSTEAMQSCFGYITIIPDFIGYGVSQDIYHPFLEPEITGRVAYDMRQASREFLRTIGYELPEKTNIAGYSLGGSMAMAMVRYYQEHGEDVKIDKIGIGCGCYEPAAAFDAFARTGKSSYCLIPTLIYSINKYHNLNLDFSKIFTGDLLANYEEWLDRSDEHNQWFIQDRIGSDLHNYMHADFFTEEKNEEFNKVYRILKELSHVDGWTPEKAIYLYHAEDDESVPFECALYAYEEFTKRGATISFFSGTGGHVGYAAQMFISLYLYLILR